MLVDGLDPRDEVLRHGQLETGAADEHHDPLGVAREVQRGLAGRVGGADEVDLLALALGRLARRGAVVDPRAPSSSRPVGLEPAVGDPGGDDHRPGLELVGAVDDHRAHRTLGPQPHGLAGHDHLGSEARHLGHRPVGEVGTGQPLGEAEVVLDRGALRRPVRRGRRARPRRSAAPPTRRRPRRRGRPGHPRRCTGRRGARRPGCAGPARRPPRGCSGCAAARRPGPAAAAGPPAPPAPARPARGRRRRAPRRATGRARGCGSGRS